MNPRNDHLSHPAIALQIREMSKIWSGMSILIRFADSSVKLQWPTLVTKRDNRFYRLLKIRLKLFMRKQGNLVWWKRGRLKFYYEWLILLPTFIKT